MVEIIATVMPAPHAMKPERNPMLSLTASIIIRIKRSIAVIEEFVPIEWSVHSDDGSNDSKFHLRFHRHCQNRERRQLVSIYAGRSIGTCLRPRMKLGRGQVRRKCDHRRCHAFQTGAIPSQTGVRRCADQRHVVFARQARVWGLRLDMFVQVVVSVSTYSVRGLSNERSKSHETLQKRACRTRSYLPRHSVFRCNHDQGHRGRRRWRRNDPGTRSINRESR
ncbi:hypothetical protein EV561_12057 [Rhizobium sp. BK376]|nr:hypothetical protein EV561_12057 [Rhizobium sp. BK376]